MDGFMGLTRRVICLALNCALSVAFGRQEKIERRTDIR